MLKYLGERMRRADTILFTGAGFSRGAQNRLGEVMPVGNQLTRPLWELSYPNESYDPDCKLPDIYSVAKSRNPRGLNELLLQHLSVDAASLPTYYAQLFSLPWYTLA